MKALAYSAGLLVGAVAAAITLASSASSLRYAGEQESAGVIIAVLAIVALAALAAAVTTFEEVQILWRNRRHPCTCREPRRWWDDHQSRCRRSWR